ncbi:MAG: glycine cleavage system protein GcvH [Pirellulales bacterium]|nr:glycine cleavage system protein GcvH [Pirellulales bacterium]
MTPQNLLYAKTHEWVKIESDPAGGKIAVVGITAFALELLTDLVYVALPEVGRKVEAGQSFGEIESVKAVSDLNSPVTGEVVAVNADLPGKLESLPKDPYGKGWFIKVKIADESTIAQLLDAAAYDKQCSEEHG